MFLFVLFTLSVYCNTVENILLSDVGLYIVVSCVIHVCMYMYTHTYMHVYICIYILYVVISCIILIRDVVAWICCAWRRAVIRHSFQRVAIFNLNVV